MGQNLTHTPILTVTCNKQCHPHTLLQFLNAYFLNAVEDWSLAQGPLHSDGSTPCIMTKVSIFQVVTLLQGQEKQRHEKYVQDHSQPSGTKVGTVPDWPGVFIQQKQPFPIC
jgi:hypothetical protein